MFRAELRKLTTTSAPKVALAVGAGGLILTQLVFVTVMPMLASGQIGPGAAALGDSFPTVDLGSAAAQLATLSPLGSSTAGSIGIAVIAVVLLGVLAGTGDYRHGGIVGAALAQPRRGRLLLAKAAAAGVAGLITGLAFALVSLLILLGTLAVLGVPVALDPLQIGGVLARGTGAVAALTVLGLAVGMLARSQLAGVLVMLAILLLEPIVQSIAQLISGALPVWAQLLPLSLANAVIGAGEFALSPAVAAAALLALTGGALALAALAFNRRDI